MTCRIRDASRTPPPNVRRDPARSTFQRFSLAFSTTRRLRRPPSRPKLALSCRYRDAAPAGRCSNVSGHPGRDPTTSKSRRIFEFGLPTHVYTLLLQSDAAHHQRRCGREEAARGRQSRLRLLCASHRTRLRSPGVMSCRALPGTGRTPLCRKCGRRGTISSRPLGEKLRGGKLKIPAVNSRARLRHPRQTLPLLVSTAPRSVAPAGFDEARNAVGLSHSLESRNSRVVLCSP